MADYQAGDYRRLPSYLPGMETVRGRCVVGQTGAVSSFKNRQERSVKNMNKKQEI